MVNLISDEHSIKTAPYVSIDIQYYGSSSLSSFQYDFSSIPKLEYINPLCNNILLNILLRTNMNLKRHAQLQHRQH